MKRIFLCLGIFAVIIGLCSFSLFAVIRLERDLSGQAADLSQKIGRLSKEELAKEAESLCQSWTEAEHTFVRFVRHAQLEPVTSAVTRLPSLAAYGDMGEFSAELDRVQQLLHHIRETEIPYLRNIF